MCVSEPSPHRCTRWRRPVSTMDEPLRLSGSGSLGPPGPGRRPARGRVPCAAGGHGSPTPARMAGGRPSARWAASSSPSIEIGLSIPNVRLANSKCRFFGVLILNRPAEGLRFNIRGSRMTECGKAYRALLIKRRSEAPAGGRWGPRPLASSSQERACQLRTEKEGFSPEAPAGTAN